MPKFSYPSLSVDHNGRMIYYPTGIRWKGYVITDPIIALKVVKLEYVLQVATIVSIGLIIFLRTFYVYFYVLAIIFCAIYQIKKLTRGLEVLKYPFKTELDKLTTSTSFRSLFLRLIASLGFVISILFFLTYHPHDFPLPLGILTELIMFWVVAITALQISYKIKQRFVK